MRFALKQDLTPGLLLLLLAARLAGAAPAALTGRVVDAASGQPLAGVEVWFDGQAVPVTTGADGRFRLEPPDQDGPQTLNVSLVGYALVRRAVDPTALAGELTVPLAQGTGAYTEHVTVVGEREPRPAAAAPRTLESGPIHDLGSVLANDPLRAVQSLPGVAWNDDFRAELSVRGNGPRQVGFSIDGVATPWLVHSVFGRGDDTGSIALVNADIVERIALDAGARAQPLGDRTGAWLDTTLREGSRAAPGVHGSLSAASASLVGEGPLGRADRGSWLVAIRQSYLDWLLRRVDPDNAGRVFGFTDLQAKTVVDLTPRHQLTATAAGGRARFDENDDPGGANALQVAHSSTGVVTVGLRSTITASLLLSQRAWTTGRDYRNEGGVGQELGRGSGSELGYRAELSWNPGRATVVDVGADVAHRGETLVVRQFVAGAAGAPPRATLTSIAAASGTIASAYAQLRWKGPRGFTAAPGARVSNAWLTGEPLASPWLLVGWTGAKGIDIAASAGIQHQSPDVEHLRGLAGDADLRAESARHLDATVARSGGTWRWRVGAYDRADRDYLRQAGVDPRRVGSRIVPGNAFAPWANALRGESRGVEASLERRAAQGWGGWVGYAYGRTRYRDERTGERFWADYDQRHGANAYGYYQLSARTRAGAKFRFGTNFPIPAYLEAGPGDTLWVGESRNTVRLPTYGRLDVSASHAFFWSQRRLTLFAEIMNVTGRTNYRAGDGAIRARTGEATGFREELLPFLPAAGFRLEF